MLEFKFDTQLLIEGKNLSEDAINDYITQNIEGDCLLARGRRGSDQDSFPYQYPLESAGILRFPGATSTMSWWKTWSARRTACKAE